MVLRKIALSATLAISLFAGTVIRPADAQFSTAAGQVPGAQWSEPVNLSQTPELWSYGPRIAVDSANESHVVWSQNTQSSRLPAPDVIMYTRRRNGNWSKPIDIVAAAQPTGQAQAMQLIVRDGILYLLWIGDSKVFLSTAHVGDAQSARAWQSKELPIADGIRYADMDWSDNARLYVLQVGASDGTLYMTSRSDNDSEFSQPEAIWMPPDSTTNVSAARILAVKGVLHVVWQLVDLEDLDGNSSGIAYIRSSDEGRSWQDEWQTADQGDDSNLMVDGTGTLHVVWNRSTEGGYRGHRASQDNGSTWSPVAYLWPGTFGRTGFPGMAVDSAGILHLVTSNDLGVGLYHATWMGQGWSNLEPVIASRDQWGERPWLAISAGNQLELVYMSFKNHDIWYTHKTINAPSVAPVVIPDQVTSGKGPGPIAVGEGPVERLPSPVAEILPSYALGQTLIRQDGTESPASPLLISALASFLLVVSLVIISLKTRSR